MMYNTKPFSYDRDTRVMAADASDIGFKPEYKIMLVSHRTNQRLHCKLDRINVDSEMELKAWEYVPIAGQVKEITDLVSRIVIFND